MNTAGNTFYAVETSAFSSSGNGSFSIVKSVAGTVTSLATFNLTIPLSPAPVIVYQDSQFANVLYNLKFLVQTDAGNSNLADLKGRGLAAGAVPNQARWQLATTDGDTTLKGASGDGGILEIPTTGTGNGTVNVVSGYSRNPPPAIRRPSTPASTGAHPDGLEWIPTR